MYVVILITLWHLSVKLGILNVVIFFSFNKSPKHIIYFYLEE